MGAEKPKISIYATVYNNINWIRQSLKSIVKNNPYFKNWELVVTDNYSYNQSMYFFVITNVFCKSAMK